MITIGKEHSNIPIVQLIHALVAVENNLSKTTDKIKQLTSAIEEHQKKIVQLTNTLSDLAKRSIIACKKVQHNEAEAIFLRGKEDEKKAHLDTIVQAKEYKIALKEFEQLKKQNMAFEETVLSDWQNAETLEKTYEQEKKVSEQKIAELYTAIEQEKKEYAELVLQQEKLLIEKIEKSALVPNEWLSRYNRMQNSVPDPIVSINNNCCGACFYTIVFQELVRIKKGELLLCRNCYRFLYFDTTPSVP